MTAEPQGRGPNLKKAWLHTKEIATTIGLAIFVGIVLALMLEVISILIRLCEP